MEDDEKSDNDVFQVDNRRNVLIAWGYNKFGELGTMPKLSRASGLSTISNNINDIILEPQVVKLKPEVNFVFSGKDSSMVITSKNNLMVCGSS